MNETKGNPWSGLDEFLPDTLAPGILLDREANIVAFSSNQARLKITLNEESIGTPFPSLVQSTDRDSLRQTLEKCYQNHQPCRLRTRWQDHKTVEGDPAVYLLFAALGEWTVVLIEHREQLEALQKVLEKRAELLSIHCEIASVSNADCDLSEAVECVLRRIARFNGWQFGHAFLSSREEPGKLDLISTAYTGKSDQSRAFRQFSSRVQAQRQRGLPDQVAEQARPILLDDCREDLPGDLAALAGELGLRSAFAFPIFINADVVGVLEFFSSEVIRARNGVELESLAAIGLQLGRVVERERSRKAREKSEEHLRLMTRQLRDAVWTYDPDRLHLTYANPALAKVWHLDREQFLTNAETWVNQVVERDQMRARRALSELHRGKPLDEELRIATATGEILWIRVRCFPIEDDQELISIAATAEDITNYKKSKAARASLEKQLRQVTEDERQKAARDLHDDLGGLLSAIGMRLEVIRRNGTTEDPSPNEKAVEAIAKLAEEAMATTRRLTRGLAPVGDHPEDLPLALRELAKTVSSRGEQECRLKATERLAIPYPPVANQLFRIAQEAVTNAVKHSGGDTIAIHLVKDRGDLLLEIIDNGQGLGGTHAKSPENSGYGLGTMRYRAEDIGADFHAGPGPDGTGLSVSCRLPAAAMIPGGDERTTQRISEDSQWRRKNRDLQVD